MKKVYRTSHGTIDSFESTGTRTDRYELTPEDSIPIFPGFPSLAEHIAKKAAKLKKAKPKVDAEREWQNFLKRITPEVWAEVKAQWARERNAADDKRDAETAARRAKIGESLRARVKADQDAKWGR